jgi:hypothetical protein
MPVRTADRAAASDRAGNMTPVVESEPTGGGLDWELGAILIWVGAVAISSISSWARLLHDHRSTPAEAIPRRAWVYYTLVGTLAGVCLAIMVSKKYGVDPLLLVVSAAGGFGGAQIMTILAVAVEVVARKTSAIYTGTGSGEGGKNNQGGKGE